MSIIKNEYTVMLMIFVYLNHHEASTGYSFLLLCSWFIAHLDNNDADADHDPVHDSLHI
jgi:hypothetical protein